MGKEHVNGEDSVKVGRGWVNVEGKKDESKKRWGLKSEDRVQGRRGQTTSSSLMTGVKIRYGTASGRKKSRSGRRSSRSLHLVGTQGMSEYIKKCEQAGPTIKCADPDRV